MSDRHERQWMMRGEPAAGGFMRLVRDDADDVGIDGAATDRADDEGSDVATQADDALDVAVATDDADADAGTAVFRSLSGMRIDRRDGRRFDVEGWDVSLDRCDGQSDAAVPFGKVLDLSAGGVRVRTARADVHPDQQIHVRLALPDTGGICPFVDRSAGHVKPAREWTGWLSVRRVRQVGGAFEVAGRLVDMEAMDRDMLRLYLSAQPMAA